MEKQLTKLLLRNLTDATSFRFQIKAIYTSGTVRYLTSPVLSLQTDIMLMNILLI